MFGNTREPIRRFYFEAWQRHCRGETHDTLSQQIVDVILEHPEYQGIFKHEDEAIYGEYGIENDQTNPFLHLGMHLAIREQVSTGRPQGLTAIHRQLSLLMGGSHQAEHALMECLGSVLWESQSTGHPPNEATYLECAQQLLNKR